jgi:hypothetical protein
MLLVKAVKAEQVGRDSLLLLDSVVPMTVEVLRKSESLDRLKRVDQEWEKVRWAFGCRLLEVEGRGEASAFVDSGSSPLVSIF